MSAILLFVFIFDTAYSGHSTSHLQNREGILGDKYKETAEGKLREESLWATQKEVTHLIETYEKLSRDSDNLLASYARKQLQLLQNFKRCSLRTSDRRENERKLRKKDHDIGQSVQRNRRGARRSHRHHRAGERRRQRSDECELSKSLMEKEQREYMEEWLRHGVDDWRKSRKVHMDNMAATIQEISLAMAEMSVAFSHRDTSSGTRKGRSTIERMARPWTLPIKYHFSKLEQNWVDADQAKLFTEAIEVWKQFTCLEFKPIDEIDVTQPYILVTHDPAVDQCWTDKRYSSIVVRIEISGCGQDGHEVFADFLHEIGHALGLEHTHQRPDREDHLKINPRLKSSQNSQYRWDEVSDYGVPFDFDSIMLYSASEATCKKKDNVFVFFNTYSWCPKNNPLPLLTMGRVTELSHIDKALVNKMYCIPECFPKNEIEPAIAKTKIRRGWMNQHCEYWSHVFPKDLNYHGMENVCINPENDPRGPYCYTNRNGVHQKVFCIRSCSETTAKDGHGNVPGYCENFCLNGGYLDPKAPLDEMCACKCPPSYHGDHCQSELSGDEHQTFLEQKYSKFKVMRYPKLPAAEEVVIEAEPNTDVEKGIWIISKDPTHSIILSFPEVNLKFTEDCADGDYLLINKAICPSNLESEDLYCNYDYKGRPEDSLHLTKVPPIASDGQNMILLLRIKNWQPHYRLKMLVHTVPINVASFIRKSMEMPWPLSQPWWTYPLVRSVLEAASSAFTIATNAIPNRILPPMWS